MTRFSLFFVVVVNFHDFHVQLYVQKINDFMILSLHGRMGTTNTFLYVGTDAFEALQYYNHTITEDRN